jgi:hypothetical protein
VHGCVRFAAFALRVLHPHFVCTLKLQYNDASSRPSRRLLQLDKSAAQLKILVKTNFMR